MKYFSASTFIVFHPHPFFVIINRNCDRPCGRGMHLFISRSLSSFTDKRDGFFTLTALVRSIEEKNSIKERLSEIFFISSLREELGEETALRSLSSLVFFRLFHISDINLYFDGSDNCGRLLSISQLTVLC